MTRELISAVAGVLLAVAAVAGCTSPAATHPKPPAPSATHDRPRPNFVFVLTDDLSWNLISHMPHLLALEQAGTTMSRYYVVDSLCCPSRSAIFTGEYPHDDGVFTNAGADGGYLAFNQHGDQQKSFAVALRDAGYRTAMMGKYLNQYQPADPIPPGWDEWDVTGNGYPEFGYTLNQDGRQVRYGSEAKDYLTDVLAAKASAFIDSSAGSGRPFMLEVATFAPHAPYTPQPGRRVARAGPPDWRQAILIEHHGPDFSPDDPDRQTQKPGDPPTYAAVRTATALYVQYAGGAQEYYDTVTDPYELDNLAAKGVSATVRQALSALENCHTGATCWAAAHLG
jgi:arylsulfatase A-like enzyme